MISPDQRVVILAGLARLSTAIRADYATSLRRTLVVIPSNLVEVRLTSASSAKTLVGLGFILVGVGPEGSKISRRRRYCHPNGVASPGAMVRRAKSGSAVRAPRSAGLDLIVTTLAAAGCGGYVSPAAVGGVGGSGSELVLVDDPAENIATDDLRRR